ncbi:MAG TPA: alpha/beta hydrolase, partial [Verrucomicrobiales bacterium]|nr:alpha/beta hydrolase [Verrucomicrobiales bacterium]
MKLLLLAVSLLLTSLPALAQTIPPNTKTGDVVYGRKFGFALTLDVYQPEKPNGCAIIYMVSGGWVSGYSPNTPPIYAPFL